MVVDNADPGIAGRDADLVFHALADATRRDIVSVTLAAELSVSALARRYPMTFAAVQKHVAVLERAGLVRKRRQGREQLVRGQPDAMRAAHQLLDQVEVRWRDRISRINDILTGSTEGAAPCP
jgi:DNA-binding transcriptional ArsR family regulator